MRQGGFKKAEHMLCCCILLYLYLPSLFTLFARRVSGLFGKGGKRSVLSQNVSHLVISSATWEGVGITLGVPISTFSGHGSWDLALRVTARYFYHGLQAGSSCYNRKKTIKSPLHVYSFTMRLLHGYRRLREMTAERCVPGSRYNGAKGLVLGHR